jgi:hypothetical protein
MTVSSFGATGIPVAYSPPLQPILSPYFDPSVRRNATIEADLPSTNKISSTFAPSAKEAEYGKRFVIAPEEGATPASGTTRANRTGNNTGQNSPEQTTPQQIGRQTGLFVDRVV